MDICCMVPRLRPQGGGDFVHPNLEEVGWHGHVVAPDHLNNKVFLGVIAFHPVSIQLFLASFLVSFFVSFSVS